MTGKTSSTDFPLQNPLQGTNAGGYDAFVAKIDPSGAALAYSTYLGGSSDEAGHGIAVDSSGNAYVTGDTYSTDFPIQNPLQGTKAGSTDAFVTKIDPSAALAYSTYLGGSSGDSGGGIAVDFSGNAYVGGWTLSTDFPLKNPLQGTNAGVVDTFVTKISEAVPISIPRAWFSPVIALPGDTITFQAETTGAPTSVDVYYGSMFLLSLTDQGGGLWSGSYTLPANIAPGDYQKINIRATDGVDTFTWPWLRVE